VIITLSAAKLSITVPIFPYLSSLTAPSCNTSVCLKDQRSTVVDGVGWILSSFLWGADWLEILNRALWSRSLQNYLLNIPQLFLITEVIGRVNRKDTWIYWLVQWWKTPVKGPWYYRWTRLSWSPVPGTLNIGSRGPGQTTIMTVGFSRKDLYQVRRLEWEGGKQANWLGMSAAVLVWSCL